MERYWTQPAQSKSLESATPTAHTNRRTVALVAVIAVAGAIGRLWALQNMEFRHDSAYWALEAHKLLNGGTLPLIGQQVGSIQVPLYNGPIMTWISAAVFAIAGEYPPAVAMLIALVNVVGIVLTFLLGSRLYSRSVGLIAALLMAASPWLTLYGRMMWPQAFFPMLMPLALLTLDAARRRSSWLLFVAFGILMGVGVQLHLSELAVLGASLVYAVLYCRPRLAPLYVLVGAAVGYAPILLYDLANNFINLRSLVLLPQLHVSDESKIYHIVKVIWNFSNVLSGQALWVSKLDNTPYLPPVLDWTQGIILSGLFLLAFAALLISAIRNSRRRWHLPEPNDGMLLIFLLLPLAYLLVSSAPINRHYFLFFYPVPLLIVARGLVIVQQWLRARGARAFALSIVWGLLSIGVAINLTTQFYMLDFLGRYGGRGEYGIIYADKTSAVEATMQEHDATVHFDVTSVQETLPYRFLYEIAGKEVQCDPLLVECAVGTIGLSEELVKQIVELPYTRNQVDSEPLFQSRGVVVIEREEMR